MKLRGQQGYAMAVLLVGMAVMAILMTAAMPVWRQASQREKEAELVFRGGQYVRAIRLFSQRAGPGVLPSNVDVLITQKFLRRKYKDPINGQDFDLLGATPAAAGGGRGATQPPPTGRGGTQTPPGGRGSAPPSPDTPGMGTIIQGRGGGPGAGGIIGVASKSKETSIRLYNGRSRYNEWQFIHVQQVQQPGTATPGPGGQPQRGGPPQPGRRGGPPTGRGGMPARGGPSPFSSPGARRPPPGGPLQP